MLKGQDSLSICNYQFKKFFVKFGDLSINSKLAAFPIQNPRFYIVTKITCYLPGLLMNIYFIIC